MKSNGQKPVIKREDFELKELKKKIIRPEIWGFARAMEEAMARNDPEKGDRWKGPDPGRLRNGLASSMLNFIEDKNRRHLVNLANYAMMLYHNSGKAAEGSHGKDARTA